MNQLTVCEYGQGLRYAVGLACLRRFCGLCEVFRHTDTERHGKQYGASRLAPPLSARVYTNEKPPWCESCEQDERQQTTEKNNVDLPRKKEKVVTSERGRPVKPASLTPL